MTALVVTILATGAEQTALTAWHWWAAICGVLVAIQLACFAYLFVFAPAIRRNWRWEREQAQARADIDQAVALANGGIDAEIEQWLREGGFR